MEGHGGGLIPPSASPPLRVLMAGYLLFHAFGYTVVLAQQVVNSAMHWGGGSSGGEGGNVRPLVSQEDQKHV